MLAAYPAEACWGNEDFVMNTGAISFVSSVLLTAVVSGAAAEQITAYRDGNTLLVQSGFTQAQDLVLRYDRIANEAAYLIPKGSAIQDYAKGALLHSGGDDYPASAVSGYGFLGGNHGSSSARKLEIPRHGMTEKDIGAKLVDAAANAWYIVGLIDRDNIMIHPESKRPGFPQFKHHTNEPLFRHGKPVSFRSSVMTQMTPGSRINSIGFLVNGTSPLPDKRVVACESVNMVIDVDAILPDAIVERFKREPGKAHDFAAEDLPAIFNLHAVYSFQPQAACVIKARYTVRHAIAGLTVHGLTFGWSNRFQSAKNQEFYIPKVKPLTIDGVAYDFAAVYQMPDIWKINYTFQRSDCIHPQDPPDRFIRIVGNNRREYGIALGCCLFAGSTAKENKAADRPNSYFLWHTKKMYPLFAAMSQPEPGTSKEMVLYRQYFNPNREPDATAFYYHRQENSPVVYLDFHKPLQNKIIRLPREYAGKTVSILEKTPSLTLHTSETVPMDGIRLSVHGNYGYLVLKLD